MMPLSSTSIFLAVALSALSVLSAPIPTPGESTTVSATVSTFTIVSSVIFPAAPIVAVEQSMASPPVALGELPTPSEGGESVKVLAFPMGSTNNQSSFEHIASRSFHQAREPFQPGVQDPDRPDEFISGFLKGLFGGKGHSAGKGNGGGNQGNAAGGGGGGGSKGTGAGGGSGSGSKGNGAGQGSSSGHKRNGAGPGIGGRSQGFVARRIAPNHGIRGVASEDEVRHVTRNVALDNDAARRTSPSIPPNNGIGQGPA